MRRGAYREAPLFMALETEGKLRITGGERANRERKAQREGAPPPSTSTSMAAQRCPHGLNLPAVAPSRHA